MILSQLVSLVVKNIRQVIIVNVTSSLFFYSFEAAWTNAQKAILIPFCGGLNENIPYRLMYLNTYSPVGAVV